MTKIYDKNDFQIIAQLYENGRATSAEIARRVGVSKEKVQYRMKKLYETGLLTGISPVIDYSSLGYQTYRLQLKLRSIPVSAEGELLKKCAQIPNVSWIVDLSGSWDLVLLFLCKTPQDFQHSLQATLDIFGGNVQKRQVTLVTSIEYFVPPSIAKSAQTLLTGSIGNASLHENEIKIIQELIIDGKKSVVDIAASLSLSATNVTHHIHQLKKKKVLLGLRPVINFNQLGKEHFKIMLLLANSQQRSTCLEILRQKFDLLYVTSVIGAYDIEFEVLAESTGVLLDELEKIKQVVGIEDMEIIYTKKERLINAFPI